MRALTYLVLVLALVGCGDNSGTPDASTADGAVGADAVVDAAAVVDASPDAAPDAGLGACPCGGTWMLDPDGELVCPTLNACGGCEMLPAFPGSSCGAGHWYYCYSGDGMSCSTTPPTNSCGWTSVLTHEPGEPCGASSLCRYVCDAIGSGFTDTTCVCE